PVFCLIIYSNNSTYSGIISCSLINSSSVTAGIYLIIIYEYKSFIILFSRITIIASGLIANFEIDFKKIIAFSTLSQTFYSAHIYQVIMPNSS
ncbi:unnamed protein product, partial [Heterotrigona itama]